MISFDCITPEEVAQLEQPPPASMATGKGSWQLEFCADTNVLLVTCAGKLDAEDIWRQGAEAVAILRQHRANGALVDCSRAILKISMGELYSLPAHYAALGASRSGKLAILLPWEHRSVELCEFYQLRCADTGFNARLFRSRDAAEAWLTNNS